MFCGTANVLWQPIDCCLQAFVLLYFAKVLLGLGKRYLLLSLFLNLSPFAQNTVCRVFVFLIQLASELLVSV